MKMKMKITSLTIALLMASSLLSSCSMGKGNQRDRNLEQAVLTRLDSVPNVEYVGKSDVRTLDGNRLHARVTASDDCSEIYTWEDLDSNILGDVKQKISDKFEEKGINMDGSLIDALIELKKQ